MKRSLILRTAVLFSALLITLMTTGPAFAQQSEFQDSTEVVLVEVPVTVTKGGEPLRELSASNFELSDNGKKQKIIGFEAVDLKFGDLEGDARLPAAARRHFLLLFDLAFTRPEAIIRARETAREILDQLHPTDLVAVGSYSSVRGLITVIGFTGDRRQAELAVDSFGLPELLEQEDDPLGLILGQRAGTDPEEWQALADQKVREILLRANAAEQVNDQKTRALTLSRNLEGISDMLGQIDGRKHLLYLSEGFDSRLLTGGQNVAEAQATNRASESGELWDVNSENRFGNTQVQNLTSGMQATFRRNDCVLHTVDLSGGRRQTRDRRNPESYEDAINLQNSAVGITSVENAEQASTADGFAGRSNESGLVNLSRNTGGMHFRNLKHLQEGLEGLLERHSLTYVLSFQPSKINFDGAEHQLKVKLKGAPRGSRLLHRKAYNAPKPYIEIPVRDRRMNAAELILGGQDGGGVATDVLAVAVPGAGDQPLVPLLVEANGADLLAGHEGVRADVELYAYAFDSEGQAVDYATQTLTFNAEAAATQMRRSGVKFWSYLELSPGEYSIRALVRNVSTGTHGIRELSIRVPDFAQEEGILAPPLFPEPSQKWLHARAKNGGDVPYPYMMGTQRFVPAARPIVPAEGSSTICLTGWNLPGGELEIEARVLAADGEPVPGTRLEIERDYPDDGRYSMVARLQTSGLEPGIYNLVTSARGDEMAEALESSIHFVVEN